MWRKTNAPSPPPMPVKKAAPCWIWCSHRLIHLADNAGFPQARSNPYGCAYTVLKLSAEADNPTGNSRPAAMPHRRPSVWPEIGAHLRQTGPNPIAHLPVPENQPKHLHIQDHLPNFPIRLDRGSHGTTVQDPARSGYISNPPDAGRPLAHRILRPRIPWPRVFRAPRPAPMAPNFALWSMASHPPSTPPPNRTAWGTHRYSTPDR